MKTIQDVREAKRFLTNEQEWWLINALSKGTKNSVKLKLAKAIRLRFLFLETRDYWKDFKLHLDGVAYVGSSLREARQDILAQLEGN